MGTFTQVRDCVQFVETAPPGGAIDLEMTIDVAEGVSIGGEELDEVEMTLWTQWLEPGPDEIDFFLVREDMVLRDTYPIGTEQRITVTVPVPETVGDYEFNTGTTDGDNLGVPLSERGEPGV